MDAKQSRRAGGAGESHRRTGWAGSEEGNGHGDHRRQWRPKRRCRLILVAVRQRPGRRSAGRFARITAATVGGLRPLWRFTARGPVTGTPAIANGVVYIGSYDGTLYALDAQTGQSRWEYATGADAFERDMKVPLGISGSAVIFGDDVIVGDANAVLHAVDRKSGNVVWRTSVEVAPNGSIWSSPVVWEETVFVGVASVAKEAGFRGSIVALDRTSGTIRWQTYMTPEGVDGAGFLPSPRSMSSGGSSSPPRRTPTPPDRLRTET